jgi:hypothetical protein
MRNKNFADVNVVSLMFIRKGFLDNQSDYYKVTNMILNSPEEVKIREQKK